jgi:hypothetical protein
VIRIYFCAGSSLRGRPLDLKELMNSAKNQMHDNAYIARAAVFWMKEEIDTNWNAYFRSALGEN